MDHPVYICDCIYTNADENHLKKILYRLKTMSPGQYQGGVFIAYSSRKKTIIYVSRTTISQGQSTRRAFLNHANKFNANKNDKKNHTLS